MSLKKQFAILASICFLCSNCTFQKPLSNNLEDALSAAKINRIELEKVLNHYSNDSLKYEAACFLIKNMVFHFYYDGKELTKYRKYFSCFPYTRKSPSELVDSLVKADGEFQPQKLQVKRDICEVDSAYLVRNIDHAFKVWREQPWGKSICFSDFCEYILPYRIGDEVLTDWREDIYNEYNPLLDSIRQMPEASDPFFAAQVLLDSLAKDMIYFSGVFPHGPHIGPGVVKWRSGDCKELADIVEYVFRAVGIPCGTDVMMMRGDNNAAHFWNFVLDKNGNTYEVEFPNPPFKSATELWNPKAKVYRTTFSLNMDMVKHMNKSMDAIYPSFRMPLFKDVTPVYAGEWNKTLTLPHDVLYSEVSPKDILYLCLSCRNEWIPVAYTHVEKDSIRFRDIEGDVIFRLATWNGEELAMCSDPILFEKTSGKIRYFTPGKEQATVSIYFKYHLYNETYIFRMPGGVFEGSNDFTFQKSDTLFLIKDVPERLYNTLYIHSDKKYRYVRFKGAPGSHCNIAEIAFYDSESSGQLLKGRIIGTPGCIQQDGSHEYTNVFDGDPYTSFDYLHPDNGWTGLDLGTPHTINRIVYVPRNRDNFIRKGDNYELLYWENRRWNSAGCKKAEADSLLYRIPKGSLLYLINHTRGYDERIFEYKDGKQRFW